MKSERATSPWLKVLFILFTLSFVPALLAILNKTGSFLPIWQQDELSGIQQDSGYAWFAMIPNEDVARLNLPLFLMEGAQVLSPPLLAVNQDLSRDIKELGGGRFQVLENNNLYFSTTDHADPGSVDRTWTVLTPCIIRMRFLLPLTGISLGLGLLIGILWLAAKVRRNQPVLDQFCRYSVTSGLVISVLVLILLLLPGQPLSVPENVEGDSFLLGYPVLQRNAVLLFVLAVCILFLYRAKIKHGLLYALAGVVLALNIGTYFWSEKDFYGVRMDTADYIEPYNAQSIRTPGYPRFIEDVMTLTGHSSDLDYWRSAEGRSALIEREDLLLRDQAGDSRGLLQVARAQKIFLAFSFLLAIGLLCWLISPWFAFLIAELALGMGLLGVYNSYLLSEVLSQAMLLLACGLFCYLMAKKSAASFLFLCFFSAVAFLVRPANAFISALPLVGAIGLLIREKRKAIATVLSGLFIAGLLALIPAMVIFRATGNWIWLPNEMHVTTGHGLSLMGPEDISKQENELAKEFLQASFDRIGQLKAQHGTVTQNETIEIALAEAERLGYDPVTANVLFKQAIPPILRDHRAEMSEIIKTNLLASLDRTRLRTEWLPYGIFLGIVVILALIRWSAVSLTGLLFVFLHNAHLLISATNQPERRYIWSTEILFLLGAGIILYNLVRLPVKNKKKAPISF